MSLIDTYENKINTSIINISNNMGLENIEINSVEDKLSSDLLESFKNMLMMESNELDVKNNGQVDSNKSDQQSALIEDTLVKKEELLNILK